MWLKKIWIAFQADLVGVDAYGNKYYESRYKRPWTTRKRRWGIFQKGTDSSQIPPEWHLWLHHTTSLLPPNPFMEEDTSIPLRNHSGTQQAHWPRNTSQKPIHTWSPRSVRQEKATRKKSPL